MLSPSSTSFYTPRLRQQKVESFGVLEHLLVNFMCQKLNRPHPHPSGLLNVKIVQESTKAIVTRS